ncbi:MAG: phosphate ABC transporter permease PstA [Verrucomicrobiae bacterium]|nr:phosphate ABC transporter permease PstA [Verrucomicrobiae bacterium]
MKTSVERRSGSPVGEVWVWVSAMGLMAGVAMILLLLGLVGVQGVLAFWPRRVVTITLMEDGEAVEAAGMEQLGGEIVRRQARVGPGQTGRGGAGEEWHVFTGSREVYGLAFRFVDGARVVRMEHPLDVWRWERQAHGPVFGYPVRLEGAGGETVPAGAANFWEVLENRLEAVERDRRRIRRLEKDEIGAVSGEMERLRRRLAAWSLRHGGDAVENAEVRRWRERQSDLEDAYERLAAEARELRDRVGQNRLVYRLLTGSEQTLELGQLRGYYAPNRLDFGGRVTRFLHRAWEFLSEEPREANTGGGIFPAIFGTFIMTLLMSVAVMPFGVVAALYLGEYASRGPLVGWVRIAVNNLAGVPSVVFGVFGLGFFVYLAGGTIDQLLFSDRLPTPTFGTGGILWASLTLALLTVPVVIVATEEALAAVPRGAREGSLACGASKWQTLQRIVLPAATPGILTGLILAMARGAGEVAPLMLVGVVKLAPDLPLSGRFPFVHLDQKFMHLGFHIYDLGFQSPDSEAARPMVFATTLLLILVVVVLNFTAIVIRGRLTRRYRGSAF